MGGLPTEEHALPKSKRLRCKARLVRLEEEEEEEEASTRDTGRHRRNVHDTEEQQQHGRRPREELWEVDHERPETVDEDASED